MLKWVIVPFVVVPLLELYLLLWLGSLIGFWPTVVVVLVTGLVGGTLAKREGLKVWRDWRRALDELRPPEQGVVDGLLVLVGGAFLLTPGVLTDALGLALLVPWSRRRIASRIRSAIDRRIANGRIHVISSTPFVAADGSDVIETTGEALPAKPDSTER
jgi:UPF0716 protein FxsA